VGVFKLRRVLTRCQCNELLVGTSCTSRPAESVLSRRLAEPGTNFLLIDLQGGPALMAVDACGKRFPVTSVSLAHEMEWRDLSSPLPVASPFCRR
jgi:hypothetical protein